MNIDLQILLIITYQVFFLNNNKKKVFAEKKFYKFLEIKMKENDNLIFSDEEIFAEYNKKKHLLLKKIKSIILKIAKKNKFEIIFKNIITIRNPKNYIKSLYYFRQSNYLNYKFEDFIYNLKYNNSFKKENSFIYWIKTIEKVYGNKFLFLPLEKINNKEYILKLSKYCNVKPNNFSNIKKNVNSIETTKEKFYFVNKKTILFKIILFLKKEFKFIDKLLFTNFYLSKKNIIKKIFPFFFIKERVKTNDLFDKKIMKLFKNDIKYIEKKYKVNFKKLGYYQ